MIKTTRRFFLRGLGAILAAPTIVTASNLMPISAKKLIMPARIQGDVFTFNNGDKWFIGQESDGVTFMTPMDLSPMDIVNMPPYLTPQAHLEQLLARFGQPWYMGTEPH